MVIYNQSNGNGKVTSNNLGGLLIDMQEGFLKDMGDNSIKERQIKSQVEMLEFFKLEDIPLVVLEYNNHGETIEELKKVVETLPRRSYVTKPYNNGFEETGLENQLREWEIEYLCLMGVNASGCVIETAIGALRRKFRILTAYELIENIKRPEYKKRGVNFFKKNGIYYTHHTKLIFNIKNGN